MNKHGVELNDKIINDVRRTLKLETCFSSQQPRVFVLGGQPGSGKSSLISNVEEKLKGNVIQLNGDDFRSIIPIYNDLIGINPLLAVEKSQPYTNALVEHFLETLSDRKYNLIVEGTLRTSIPSLNTAHQLIAKGYSCELMVVTAHRLESWTGCLFRRETDMARNGVGRPVALASHDEAFNNIPATLRTIKKEEIFAKISLFDRKGNVLFECAQHEKKSVELVYEKLRERISHERVSECLKNLDSVDKLMQKRTPSLGEKEEVQKLKENLEKMRVITLKKEPQQLSRGNIELER